MFNLMNLRAALLALVLGLFSISAQADFTSGMSVEQIQSEIQAMLTKTNPATGKLYSLIDVGNAAKAAGITAGQFTAASIGEGTLPALAVTASIIVWGDASAPEVVTAALTASPKSATDVVSVANGLAPDQSNNIVTAALSVPTVNPADVTAATAAGPAAPGTLAALTAAAAAAGGGAGGGGGGGVASPA